MQDDNLINNIGFGCVSLTSLPFESEAIRLLETAYNIGIRLFDTAPIYGNGYSEKIVGKFSINKRHNITLTTKFGLNRKDGFNIPPSIALPLNYLRKKFKKGNSSSFSQLPLQLTSQSLVVKNAYRRIDKPEIEGSFYKSLKSLKTDYIDNYLLHEGMPSFLTEEAISFVMKLKKDGKVRRIGVAAGSRNLIDENDFLNLDILQYENNVISPSNELVVKFPKLTHIYHSVLKGVKSSNKKSFSSNEFAALLLLKVLKINPNGKVLFSTTKAENLIQNIKGLEKYKSFSIEEINFLVNNALY